jgi:Domain of unknown function (DUF1841)
VSPRSRGRPPSRGGRRQSARPQPPRRQPVRSVMPLEPAGSIGPEPAWFDDPDLASPRSWAMPPAHGSYQGIDLELLDPDDENDRMLLIEAQHPEYEAALRDHAEVVVGGEPVNPQLHITMHQIVVNQVLAAQPPEVWPTVRRLAGLGYDWHNIIHMIAALVADDVHGAMTWRAPFDPADYARRLSRLPGDWPLPER